MGPSSALGLPLGKRESCLRPEMPARHLQAITGSSGKQSVPPQGTLIDDVQTAPIQLLHDALPARRA